MSSPRIVSLVLIVFSATALLAQAPLEKIQGVPFSQVAVTDEFWRPKMEKVATVTLQACIDQTESKTGRIRNFEKAAAIRDTLLKTLRLTEDDLYLIDGPLSPTGLMALYDGDHSPELRDPPFLGVIAPPLREREDLFAAIREHDVLLHHPYDCFESVVEFLEKAVADPNVLAIKMTLYRTNPDSGLIPALVRADLADDRPTLAPRDRQQTHRPAFIRAGALMRGEPPIVTVIIRLRLLRRVELPV